jgi:hypothetical protein
VLLGDWPKSRIETPPQSEALIADTYHLSRAYADPQFISWFPDSDPNKPDVLDMMRFLRYALDVLLYEYASSGQEVATPIEVYLIPSYEISSHVSRLPSGFAIGVAPFLELVGEILYQLPSTYTETLGVISPRANDLAFLDECVESYLRHYINRAPSGRLRTARYPALYSPLDVTQWKTDEEFEVALARIHAFDSFHLPYVFALCHELVHIVMMHFSRPSFLRSSDWIQQLPDELRWEVEADCASFVDLRDFYMRHHFPRAPDSSPLVEVVRRVQRERGRVPDSQEEFEYIIRLANHRALETMESYYAAMTLALAFAESAGNAALAARLAPIVVRKQYARRYIAWLFETQFPPTERAAWELRGHDRGRVFDDYIVHALRTVIKPMVT